MKKQVKTDTIWYQSDNIECPFLSVSDSFVYEMIVYVSHQYGFSQYDNKETKTKDFKGFTSRREMIKGKTKYIQYIDLVGAPISFLEENGYYKV